MALKTFELVLKLTVSDEFNETPDTWDWPGVLSLEKEEGENVTLEGIIEITDKV